MMAEETKSIAKLELKFDDEPTDSGIIKGHAAVFNNIDFGKDKILKGAFRKTLRETKQTWPIFKNHITNQQIGFNFKAKEDDFGLMIEEQLNLEEPMARSILGEIRLGMKINKNGGLAKLGLSIGFFAIKAIEETINKVTVRVLKEIRMVEHSHTPFPMNQLALVSDAKDLETVLTNSVDEFYLQMEDLGYNGKQIIEALKIRAASNGTEPDLLQKQILHSTAQFMKVIKGE